MGNPNGWDNVMYPIAFNSAVYANMVNNVIGTAWAKAASITLNNRFQYMLCLPDMSAAFADQGLWMAIGF